MGIGIVLFATGEESVCFATADKLITESTRHSSFIGYLCPTLAGLFFALTNLLTKRIDEKKVQNINGQQFDEIDLTYYSLFISTLMCFIITFVFIFPVSKTVEGLIRNQDYVQILIYLGICTFLSVIAGLLVTRAFTRTQNVALISSLDLTIVVFSVPIDLWRQTLCLPDLVGTKGLALLLVAGGAIWLTFSK